jgi:hypothetical protein
MSMIRARRLYIVYTCDYKVICIVLHCINKSAFIILLEIVDSLRCFCVTVSSLYYILLQDMRSKSIRITQTLTWILLTVVEASLPPFYGLLCLIPLLYYFENDIYISVGV